MCLYWVGPNKNVYIRNWGILTHKKQHSHEILRAVFIVGLTEMQAKISMSYTVLKFSLSQSVSDFNHVKKPHVYICSVKNWGI